MLWNNRNNLLKYVKTVAYNVLFNLGDTMVQWFTHWTLGQDVLV